ncbi:MAG: phosphatase PAP2 family protein [Gammaproteobacteria bacterium]|nr:phosphatase PAP2 family protein [Gammaproteobacteria bacterium]
MRLFLGLSLGAAVVFILFPGLDLGSSSLFYDKAAGGFFLNNRGFDVVHSAISEAGRIITLALFILLAISWLSSKVGAYLSCQRILWFLFLAFALGPGLVVDVVFKDHFGRARPAAIVEFGGDKMFTPAFVISDQCDKNCSFVCGSCSVGFAILAFALLTKTRRKRYIAGATVFGGLVGLMRIVQGAHFLSDVIFSGVFTMLVTYTLYELLKPGPEMHASAASSMNTPKSQG